MQAGAEQEETKRGSRRLPGAAAVRCGAAGGGGAVVAVEGLRWPAELLLLLPLPPLFFSLLFFFRSSDHSPASSFLFFSFGPLPSPLVFSSPLFFSLVFFSFLFFFVFLLFFLCFFLFFLSLGFFVLFSPFFFRVSCLPCIYRGEKETYTPAQSMTQRCRVDGAATIQPPLDHPRDTSPPLTLTHGKLCGWRGPWSASF